MRISIGILCIDHISGVYMSHERLNLDLTIKDHSNKCANSQQEIVIGDLHANALKMIKFLISHGVLSFNSPDYEKLKNIYIDAIKYLKIVNKSEKYESDENLLRIAREFDEMVAATFAKANKAWSQNNITANDIETAENKKIDDVENERQAQAEAEQKEIKAFKDKINQFESILFQACEVNVQIGLVRFLGDMLADRGPNDALVLFVVKMLSEKKVKFEILLSNHDLGFITSYEKEGLANPIERTTPVNSLIGLSKIIQAGIIEEKKVKKIFQEHYLPRLKLLSYSIEIDRNGLPELKVYSHALINLETIKNLYQKTFNIAGVVDFDSIQGLTDAIDKINENFKQFVLAGEISDLFSSEPGPTKMLISADSPLNQLIWNRKLSRYDSGIRGYFKLTFVHGHTNKGKTLSEGYINLDTEAHENKPYLLHIPHSEIVLTRVNSKPKVIDEFVKLFELKKLLLQIKDAPLSESIICAKKICLYLTQIGETLVKASKKEQDGLKILLSDLKVEDCGIIHQILMANSGPDGSNTLATLAHAIDFIFPQKAKAAEQVNNLNSFPFLNVLTSFIQDDLKKNTKYRLCVERKIQHIKEYGKSLKDKHSNKNKILLKLAQKYSINADEYFIADKSNNAAANKFYNDCNAAYLKHHKELAEPRFSRTLEHFLTWLAGTLTIGIGFVAKMILNKRRLGRFKLYNSETTSEVKVNDFLANLPKIK